MPLTLSAQNRPVQQMQQPKLSLLAELTAKGQKINGIAIEYESEVLASSDLTLLYQVSTQLDNQVNIPRQILRAYTNNQAQLSSQANLGKFVIIELDSRDKNADLYQIKLENETPIKVRVRGKEGDIIMVEKKQPTRVPHYYHDRLTYHISQNGYLKLSNGKILDKIQLSQVATPENVITPYLDQFSLHKTVLNSENNSLNYRLYTPEAQLGKKYPLTIFLHGSGQVGTDNIAHLISSKGVISTLQYEQGFVLAPQYTSVFDPFDDVNKGQKGGIHWQTQNRQQLVLKMIDETIKANPNIDPNRIYLIGLSRGAEGALNLLLTRPQFFAGALLMSGREVGTIEWIDGNSRKGMLEPIKHMPIWFFHSRQDNISPVAGTRLNYHYLMQLNAPNVKYTEFNFEQAGDNGIINHNPHNTWDAVFNSPEIMLWLLNQKKK